MKKPYLAALVMASLLTFTACGSRNNNTTPTKQTTTPTSRPTTAPTIMPTMPSMDPTLDTNIPDPSVDTSMPDMGTDSTGSTGETNH